MLTLLFDDIVTNVDGDVMFYDDMAVAVICFIEQRQKSVDALLIHCCAGRPRSQAVGAFAVEMLSGDNSRYFEEGNTPNMFVYYVLEST